MLPKIQSPSYTLIVPSTGEKVKFRAFTVKEEKMLAIALQDGQAETVTETLKDIVRNCTFGKLDPNKIASFDYEYIFLQLRSKSKGNEVELTYECRNEVEGAVCKHINTFKMDLDNITVAVPDKKDLKIMITDSIGIMMKYPNLDNIIEVQNLIKENNIKKIFEKIDMFIECVFDGEEVFEINPEEFASWIEDLDGKQFKRIEDFIRNLPSVKFETHVKCAKCGHEEHVILQGLHDFLD